MPAMVAFGRRWLIGTDDLLLMGVPDVLAYFLCMIWSGLKAYNWFSSDERYFCDNSLFLDVGVSAFFANVAVAWVFGMAFIFFSTRGTISQVEARSTCVALFHIKTVCVFLNFLNLVYTCYLLHVGNFCKSSSMELTLLMATVAQLIFAMVQLLFWWMIFDEGGRSLTNKTKNKFTETKFSLGSIPQSTNKKWQLRSLTSFMWLVVPSKDKRNAVNTVSEMVSYISHELDMVFSDLVAGVLWMRQKHLKYYKKEELRIDASAAITLPDGSPVDYIPTTDMPSWMNLHLAKQYFQIGKGVFESRRTVYQNIASLLCRLWNHLMSCLQWRNESVLEENNGCGYNMSVPLVDSSVPYKDLIYVSFQNKVYVLPFLVTVDAHTMSVVISVGGTMSFNDVVTNLATGLAPMEDLGDHKDLSCHAGILKAARKIKDKLEDRRILEAAFQSRKGYHLITTGHSLGAGVAAVLGFLFRPVYPSIRCFAFEPPPCVSANTLEITFDFVFSLLFGNDFVPYLSSRNVEHMIRGIVKCTEECNMPKYKVLFYPLPEYGESSTLLQDEREIAPNSMQMSAHETDQSSEEETAEARPSLDDSNADDGKKNNRMNKSSLKQSKKTDLYIPGRVLHIRHSKKGYRLQIRTAQDFHPLMIQPDMVICHFPQYIEGCLEQLGHTYTLLAESL